MNAASELIVACRQQGITMVADGEDLRVEGPDEGLTEDLLDQLKANKPALLAALTHPDPLPPLSRAQEARRRKVLDMLARDGTRYAVYVEDPNTDTAVLALASPAGTADVLIPQDKYDAFALLELMKGWELESLPQAGPGDAEPVERQ